MSRKRRSCSLLLIVTVWALGTALADDVKPKIFAYTLPDKFHETKFLDQILAPTCFYSMDYFFPKLLKESPHWTQDPKEADFFYVDAWMYWPWQSMDEVITELRKAGPWFDAKGGADHIFMITADPGRCNFPGLMSRNAIFLHHFGKLQSDGINKHPCDLFQKWGAACDPLIKAGLDAQVGVIQPDGCHLPYQDIVVPPSPYEDVGEPYEDQNRDRLMPTPYVNEGLAGLERKYKLYYAGKIDLHQGENHSLAEPWSDAHYSFGSRQTVYRMFAKEPNYLISTKHLQSSYWKDLASSVFCLATAGWAWGGRMKVSVTRGCIPVIIQDGIKVEFEEQLPLEDYAVRVPTWLVHKLPQILDLYIESGRVAKMQKALECAWRLHWWRRPHGRAFEVVMCELKRRLLGSHTGPIKVDWDKCEVYCGDDKPVPLGKPDVYNNV